ncbi:conserved exported protein of unknown function [Pseudodesulfovibrio profundus]|uniref:Membrane protein involved in aromatic hydrocarbon degradation n=1 Tax=Pseudodesulfovibrio profundus TaxID=57320 RepID=A0A2C8F697_9BACT|nr:OmpP1/FadL family transporter [Pseudodesulfovibrio profundus]SOB58119.1 conserved exported protein of unknown function [Pseudodesulfovibrio profundus]
MKRASVLVYCSLFICLLASTAHAGGFALYEWGSRAIGMGTANIATGTDASVVAYNPALMTQFDSAQVMTGVAAITPQIDVNITDNGGGLGAVGNNTTESQTFMVPHAYYVQPLTDRVTAGVGVFTRYGLGMRYDDDWGGRYLLQEVLLESYSMNPSLAFKVNDNFSFAFGVEVMQGSMKLDRAIPVPFPAYSTASIEVEGTSVGGNIALDYKFNDQWNVGFQYRTPTDFAGYGDVNNDYIGSDHVKVSATFPSSYNLGLGYRPTEDLTFEFSVIHTRWEYFDKMKYNYGGDNPNYEDSETDFYYKNTWRFQLGAEYWLTDMFALRGGYVYDQTPTRHEHASVMLPANDRNLFSLGLGFKGDHWFVDAAGMYIVTKERHGITYEASDTATYSYDFKNGSTTIFSLSGGYQF